MSAYSRPYSATKSSAAARAPGASRQGEKLKHEKIGVVPFSSLQMDGPAGYTNCAYWDTMARDYDGEIMSSFDEDVKKVIKRRVDDGIRRTRQLWLHPPPMTDNGRMSTRLALSCHCPLSRARAMR